MKSAKKFKPTFEQKRFCEVLGDKKLLRTLTDEGPKYLLDNGEPVHCALAENLIKHGLLSGNRDGLIDGWSQSYSLSALGLSFAGGSK